MGNAGSRREIEGKGGKIPGYRIKRGEFGARAAASRIGWVNKIAAARIPVFPSFPRSGSIIPGEIFARRANIVTCR